jgi:hypothetical protein
VIIREFQIVMQVGSDWMVWLLLWCAAGSKTLDKGSAEFFAAATTILDHEKRQFPKCIKISAVND